MSIKKHCVYVGLFFAQCIRNWVMATVGSEIVGLFSEVGDCTIVLLFVIFP